MDEREELVREKIEAEDLIEKTQLRGIREVIQEILIKGKGFDPEEIEVDPVFRVKLADFEAIVTIDFVLIISGTYFMVVKCVATAMESWERYAISFARAASEYQIPYATVTDGNNIRIFDAISGSLISESFGRFFNHKESKEIIRNFKKISPSEKSLEKQRRIIYAFENIKHLPLQQD